MTIGEFIKYHKSVEDVLKDYNISFKEGVKKRDYDPSAGEYDLVLKYEIQHKVFPEIKIYSFVDWKEGNSVEYTNLCDLNKLSNTFNKSDLLKYVVAKELFKELPCPRYYGSDYHKNPTSGSDKEIIDKKFLRKLEELENVLGHDYKIPDIFFKHQIENSKENPFKVFDISGDITNQICADIGQILLDEAIEKNKSLPSKEPVLIARMMHKEEFDKFQTDGIVSGIDYTGTRNWSTYNSIGNYGDYAFMTFRNMEDALKNISSVLPYFEYDCGGDYLVFFKAKNIPDDMYYSSKYTKRAFSHQKEGIDFEPVDNSAEVGVPFYSNENFEILSFQEINQYTLNDIMINKLKEMNVLKLPDINNLDTTLFDNFEKNRDRELEFNKFSDDTKKRIKKDIKSNCDIHSQKYSDDLIKYEKDRIRSERIDCQMWKYYSTLAINGQFAPTTSDVLSESLQFAKLMQEKYNLSDTVAYQVAAYTFQYVDDQRSRLKEERDTKTNSNIQVEYDIEER